MAVELTPKGTRGMKIPNLPRPLMKLFMGVFLLSRRLQGMPLLNLTTRGAKSGQLRTVPLRWFSAGPDAWLVVASLGGAAQHPAWYVNMAKNPDQVWIELGSRKVRVVPESLKGAERAEVWRRIVTEAPGYGAYQEKTDREIPVIRLRAAPERENVTG
jgi:deazaflavin-dependent oxidoreductase (nitroreductase family)